MNIKKYFNNSSHLNTKCWSNIDILNIIAMSLIIIYMVIFVFVYDSLTIDFKAYYVASKFIHEFSAEKLYDIKFFLEFNKDFFPKDEYAWFYPPTYLLHIYGVGFLPYAVSNPLFILCGVTLLSVGIYVMSPSLSMFGRLMFYFFSTSFVFFTILTAQNTFYSVSFLMIGLYFLDKRPWIAGICFAFLTYKPQFVWVLPFALLLTRHYKVFFIAGLFTVLQIITSIYMFGIASWIAFFKSSDRIWELLAFDGLPVNIMSSSYATLIMLHIPMDYAKPISIIFMLIVGITALYIWRKRGGDNLAKAILCAGIILASPYLFHYDNSMLIAVVMFYLLYVDFKPSQSDILLFYIKSTVYFFLLIISITLSVNFMICISGIVFYVLLKKHFDGENTLKLCIGTHKQAV